MSIVIRNNLLKLWKIFAEVIKDHLTLLGTCGCHMLLDHLFELQYIVFICDRLRGYQLFI